jgi:sirohydrochlorin ferrochelatase
MVVALIDNGSLVPAAHLNLRAVAAALSTRAGVTVHAVSWKHSDRISPDALEGARAWTLAPFVRAQLAAGKRDFVFVPFFVSPQGAIGSALREDLERLRGEVGAFSFSFTDGLTARGAIVEIAAARIRETLAANASILPSPPPVIVVDHGGPSVISAVLRDELATHIAAALGAEIGPLVAASMEGAHGPLLADQLNTAEFADRAVIVAPLFLAPGRHAGPAGDIVRICRASRARCHVADLIGTHPLAIEALAAALIFTLSHLQAETFA